MRLRGEIKRRRIIEAADKLFYQQGYQQTSFTEIAAASSLNRGNFYYYFKTKDDILRAVIQMRYQQLQSMLASWDEEFTDPKERMKHLGYFIQSQEDNLVHYGCPQGTLISELSKEQSSLYSEATELLDVVLKWLEKQFKALDYADKSSIMAMRFLAKIQGISLLANVYRNKEFLQHEICDLLAWLDKV